MAVTHSVSKGRYRAARAAKNRVWVWFGGYLSGEGGHSKGWKGLLERCLGLLEIAHFEEGGKK